MGSSTRLRQLDLWLQVLYVSGYTDGAIARVAELENEQAFLQKPLALGFLAQKVRSVLDAANPKTSTESRAIRRRDKSLITEDAGLAE